MIDFFHTPFFFGIACRYLYINKLDIANISLSLGLVLDGKVIVDGTVCYDHRFQMANPFPLKPLPPGMAEIPGISPQDLEEFVPYVAEHPLMHMF